MWVYMYVQDWINTSILLNDSSIHCITPPNLVPLTPNICIQFLQTDLHTFPWKISWENLIKDQSIFALMFILLIDTTFLLIM